ncbi:MAG: hypothetical protein AAGA67_00075 [Cyanobacteria bacterium P01_F01_bin.153]
MEFNPDQRTVERLSFAIEMGQGQFKLMVVRCNYKPLVDAVMARLVEICPVTLVSVWVDAKGSVLERVTEAVEQNPEAGCVVVRFAAGMDREVLTQIFGAANRAREVFRDRIKRPIVLWLDDAAEAVFMDAASDLESLSTGASLGFDLDRGDLLGWVRSQVDGLVGMVLGGGSMPTPIAQWQGAVRTLGGEDGLESGELSGEEAADVLVLEGRANWLEWLRDPTQTGLVERAAAAYGRSLELWLDTASEEDIELWQRAGVIQVWLAELWRSRGKLARGKYFDYWRVALDWQDWAISTFREAGDVSSVARFLPDLGAELQRLSEWERLATAAEELVGLSESGALADGFRLAQGYGFLGKVALEREEWEEARGLFEQSFEALGEYVDLSEERRVYWAWLMLSRSRALWQLERRGEALENIQLARDEMEPEPARGPRLTVAILNQARDFLYEDEKFEEAFRIKRSRRSIEQQFRLKAFVGAGQVRATRLEQLVRGTQSARGTVSEEIRASGRQDDVDALMLRLENTETRLTVICGFSGVGKSSLVSAGLVPAITAKRFGNLVRRGIPLVVRRYEDWRWALARALLSELWRSNISRPDELMFLFAKVSDKSDPGPDNQEKESVVLNVLQKLHAGPKEGGENAKPVFVLDQFEDFFTHRSDRRDHEPLFNFLGQCLKAVPSLDIVMSIRRDYVHHLLDWPMLTRAAGEGTLSDQALFLVDDFSRDRAIAVMQRLCEQVDFGIDSPSLTGIVDDLAIGEGETAKVRPIELQLVGAQLEAEGVRSLAKYREKGGKLALVRNYLNEVKQDCGPRLVELAGDVLVLMVGDARRGLRPAKGRSQLRSELAEYDLVAQDKDLAWILKVFVGAGIAFELPGGPEPKFQLVHDYLAEFIRDNEQPLFQQVLAAALEKREEAERSLAVIQKEVAVAEQDRKKLRRANHIGVGLLSTLIVIAGSVGFWSYSSVREAETQTEIAKLEQAAAERQRLEADYLRRDAEFREAEAELFIARQDRSLERLERIGELTHNLKLESMRLIPFVMQSVLLIDNSSTPSLLKSSLYNHLVVFPQEVPKLTLELHQGTVLSASFSPDGKTILTASHDGTAKLWDLEGQEIQSLNGHQDWVLSASFSPDGKTILTASEDGTAKLWDREGNEIQTLNGHQFGVRSASFSPDGKTILTASDDRTVKLWDLKGNNIQTLNGHQAEVLSANFSLDGKTILTASRDGMAKLWDRENKEIQALNGHQETVWGASFSPDGKTILTASRDGTAKLWDREGNEIQTLNGHQFGVRSASFSPDGKTILTASDDRTVKLWDFKGNEIQTLNGHQSGVRSARFSPDGKTILTASDDGTAKLWDREGNEIRTLNGHQFGVRSASFSPDGKTIVTAASDGTVKLWNRDGKAMQTFTAHQSEVWSAGFSPDGETIATVSANGTAKLWDLEGRELQTPTEYQFEVRSASFSPDGEIIITALNNGTAKLWEFEGKAIQILTAHQAGVRSASFSPDGKTIVTAASDGTVKLWPVETIDNLLAKGCDWLRDYLTTNPNAPETLQQYCKVTPNRPRQDS